MTALLRSVALIAPGTLASRMHMRRASSINTRIQPGPESEPRQTNLYDKILKENMEAILPGLAKKFLDIRARQMEDLPNEIQHTIERKPDLLKKVIDINGENFILHIEFQTTDDEEMPYRMLEYFAMLSRRYRLPIRQYVIYLGKGAPRKMMNPVFPEQLPIKYQLIIPSSIDYRLLLQADNPEEKILAILGDFGKHTPAYAVKSIAKEVIRSSKGELSSLRHIKQLHIFARLRNFTPQIINNMDHIFALVKGYKKDIFYITGEKEGREKGVAQGRLEVAKSLLLQTGFSMRKIASLAGVSESVVRRIKRSLQP